MSWEIAVSSSFVGVGIVMVLIGMALDEEHAPLKLLFMGIAIWMIALALSSNLAIVDSVTNTSINNSNVTDALTGQIGVGYKAVLTVGLFTAIYFTIYLIWAGASIIKWKKKREE